MQASVPFTEIHTENVHLTLRSTRAKLIIFSMKVVAGVCTCLWLLVSSVMAAQKTHSVLIGKWATVKRLNADDDRAKPQDLRVRPLVVDGRVKELTTGTLHDVTERTFVVQRVYRINGFLPQETGATRWLWERGAWLLVDRVSGKVQVVSMAAFDPYASSVNWFRDYAAYCGISEDGKNSLAVVWQLGKRKPLLKKALSESAGGTGEACPLPAWNRNPARVTFSPRNEASFTYTFAVAQLTKPSPKQMTMRSKRSGSSVFRLWVEAIEQNPHGGNQHEQQHAPLGTHRAAREPA
jgi:hypothetical protein